jgi:hypothetical protein
MGEYVATARTHTMGDQVSGGCFWCGRKPRNLYGYGGRGGWFCNVGCAESYHGEEFPRPIQAAS